MKHSAAYIAALASLSSASPLPQFSIPSFSIPSIPGFSLPSFPIPTGGPGLGLPSSGPASSTTAAGGNLPSSVEATATSGAEAAPTTSGTAGGDCTAQGSTGGSTENGVADISCCTDMTVIFARGTGELGNVGSISGPPMFESLRSKLGAEKVTVQGVDYPASAAGNVNLGADGGSKMAGLVKTALSQCPSTKVVISGYSQGAMVVHNALSAGGLESSQVAAAVLFGDPLISQAVGDLPEDQVKEFCATADTICGQPTGDVSGSHLSYGSAADAAADFAISAAGLS